MEVQLLQQDKSLFMKYGRGNQDCSFLKRLWLHSHCWGSAGPSLYYPFGDWLLAFLRWGPRMDAFVQGEQKGIPIQANFIVDLTVRENVSGASVWFNYSLKFKKNHKNKSNPFPNREEDILHIPRDLFFFPRVCSLRTGNRMQRVLMALSTMTKTFQRVAIRSVVCCGGTNYLGWSWVQNSWQQELKQILVGGRVRELRNLLVKGLLYCCLFP